MIFFKNENKNKNKNKNKSVTENKKRASTRARTRTSTRTRNYNDGLSEMGYRRAHLNSKTNAIAAKIERRCATTTGRVE